MPQPATNSRHRRGVMPVGIYYGRVMNVNKDEYSVDVHTEHLGQVFQRIGYSCLYTHHANGEGTFFIPDVGAFCWVCVPSDHNRGFVLAFESPISTVDDYRGNRPGLLEGDQAMISRDLNGIIVRKGGITQVGATPGCQRIYSPVANTIRDICENYEMNAAGGNLRWTVRRQLPDERFRSQTVLVLEAREFAQDTPKIKVSVGSVETPKTSPPAGPRIAALRKVYLDVEIASAVPGVPRYRYRVNLDGESFLLQAGRRSVLVKGDDIEFIEGDVERKVFGDEDVTVVGDVTSKYATETKVVVGRSKETVGTKVIIAPQIFLGGEAGAVPTLRGPETLAWMNAHIHDPVTQRAYPALPTLLTTVVKVR